MTDPSTIRPFRRLLVIHNPTAGGWRRRRLAAVLMDLATAGCASTLHATTCRGDAEAAARNAARQGYDLVVVAGGDGTVNEVANGLATAEQVVPLALVPMGTANVLAAEIGLAANSTAPVHAILGGRRRPMRLCQAGDRHFVLMASVGVDAAVVHGVDLALKRRAGKLAYAVEALRQGLQYRFPQLTVTIDGVPHLARMAVASKARCYGGPFQVAPGADLGDQWLHVVLLERGGITAVLRYGLAMATGNLARLPDVGVVRGLRVVFSAPAGVPVQADGDPLGGAPLELSVSDRCIDLVVP